MQLFEHLTTIHLQCYQTNIFFSLRLSLEPDEYCDMFTNKYKPVDKLASWYSFFSHISDSLWETKSPELPKDSVLYHLLHHRGAPSRATDACATTVERRLKTSSRYLKDVRMEWMYLRQEWIAAGSAGDRAWFSEIELYRFVRTPVEPLLGDKTFFEKSMKFFGWSRIEYWVACYRQ